MVGNAPVQIFAKGYRGCEKFTWSPGKIQAMQPDH